MVCGPVYLVVIRFLSTFIVQQSLSTLTRRNGPSKAAMDSVVPDSLEEKKPPPGSRQSKRHGPHRPDSEAGRKSSLSRKKQTVRDRRMSTCQVQSLTCIPKLTDSSEVKGKDARLVKFRWSLPPFGDAKIKIHFKSQDIGQFDFTFNFEIVGTKRCYQVFCRGICSVPQICWEPKIVFPKMKNTVAENAIIHKCFVEDEKMYYFGPLHCGKTRER